MRPFKWTDHKALENSGLEWYFWRQINSFIEPITLDWLCFCHCVPVLLLLCAKSWYQESRGHRSPCPPSPSYFIPRTLTCKWLTKHLHCTSVLLYAGSEDQKNALSHAHGRGILPLLAGFPVQRVQVMYRISGSLPCSKIVLLWPGASPINLYFWRKYCPMVNETSTP